MNKPVPYTREPIIEYWDLIRFIEQKYSINTDNYFTGDGRNYESYWHWLLENEFEDDTYPVEKELYLSYILEGEDTPDWVKDITQLIFNEFGEHINNEGALLINTEF